MCGRYGFTTPEELQDYYNLDDYYDSINPSYNAAPTQMMPVITNSEKKKVEIMKWGLVPYWAKDMSIGNKMINARAEGIEEKPSFKKPFKSQRCLVPANFFFEWKRIDKEKIPYLIKLNDKQIFSFAGLYDEVIDGEGKPIRTFTIITTEPNELMSDIHTRMPVILSKEEEELWLNPDITEKEQLKPLLNPFPAEEMHAYVVSRAVNTPANNYAELIKPEVNSL